MNLEAPSLDVESHLHRLLVKFTSPEHKEKFDETIVKELAVILCLLKVPHCVSQPSEHQQLMDASKEAAAPAAAGVPRRRLVPKLNAITGTVSGTNRARFLACPQDFGNHWQLITIRRRLLDIYRHYTGISGIRFRRASHVACRHTLTPSSPSNSPTAIQGVLPMCR